MKIFVIGWGSYIQHKKFTIEFEGAPTIEKIGPEIRKGLQNRLSSEVFEYIYEKIRIFKDTGDHQNGVSEVTSNEDLRGAENLLIMPGQHGYESFLEEASEKRSKLMYRDSKQRFFSLAGMFGITNEFEKSQEKLVKTMYELGTLGFFGSGPEKDDGSNEITIQCGHCYRETKILKTLSTEQIQTIHAVESPTCVMKNPDIARRICDEKERIENYYTSQLAYATHTMIQQSNRAEFYARKRYQERQRLFLNARHPRISEREDNRSYDCAVCGMKVASVIAIPCYHLSMCNSCFLQLRDVNDEANTARGDNEPVVKLRCPLCNTEPTLFTKIFGGT